MALPAILSGISPEIITFATSFVFMFAVIFALLVYSGMFAKKDKEGKTVQNAPKGPLVAIAGVIAVAAAFYGPFNTFLQQIIPLASMFFVVVFFFVFIKQIMKRDEKSDPWPAMIAISIFLVVLGIAWDSVQTYLGFTGITPDTMLWIIGVLAVLMIFYMAYSAKQEK